MWSDFFRWWKMIVMEKSWFKWSKQKFRWTKSAFNTIGVMDYVGDLLSPTCCLKTVLWSTSSIKPSSVDSLSLSSSSTVPSLGKYTCSCFGPLVGKALLKHGIPSMDKFSWHPSDFCSFTQGLRPHWLMFRLRAGLATWLSLGRGRSGREKCVYTGLQAGRGPSKLSQGSDGDVRFCREGQNFWENISHSGLWRGIYKAGSVFL